MARALVPGRWPRAKTPLSDFSRRESEWRSSSAACSNVHASRRKMVACSQEIHWPPEALSGEEGRGGSTSKRSMRNSAASMRTRLEVQTEVK